MLAEHTYRIYNEITKAGKVFLDNDCYDCFGKKNTLSTGYFFRGGPIAPN